MTTCLAPAPHGPECGGPPLTLAQRRVVDTARAEGWLVEWHHRLLVVVRRQHGTLYLAQVLFRDGRWDYAITFNRPGGLDANETESVIVETLRNFFDHLRSPR